MVAKTLMSELGESPQRSGGDEELIPCLGDNTSKAGHIVYIDVADGRAKGLDGNSATAGLAFAGIMDRNVTIDYDTAITTDYKNNVIVPVSGRKYSCFIADPGATIPNGAPLSWGDTAGVLKVITSVVGGTLNETYTIDDTVDILKNPIVAYLDDGSIITTSVVANIRWA